MVHHPGRISIIGAGTLGGTIAYSLMLANTAKEILLVDMSYNIVQGQVLDLAEVQSTSTVRAGTFKEAGQSTLVILAANSLPNHTDEDRTQWLRRSRRLLLSIASSMSPVHSEIMILVISSPVDLYVQSLQSYFPHVTPNRIFGLGTTMATARLVAWLHEMVAADMSSGSSTYPPTITKITDAYCIGSEDSPVVVWHHAKIDNVPINVLPNLTAQRAISDKIVSSHRKDLICSRKGNAWFGQAAVVARIALDIIKYYPGSGPATDLSLSNSTTNTNTTASRFVLDPLLHSSSSSTTDKTTLEGHSDDTSNPIWVLSVNVPKYNCCLSWPVVLCSTGVKHLVDIPLSPDEEELVLKLAASNIADFQASIGNEEHDSKHILS